MTSPDPHNQTADPATVALVAALAGLLAARGARAATTTARGDLAGTREATQVVTALTDAGIPDDVARAVLALTLKVSPLPRARRVHLANPAPADTGHDPLPPGTTKVTRRRTQILNLTRRAQYLLAAGRRVADVVAELVADGAGRLAALRAAIAGEVANWAAHVDAARNRADAAKAVDEAADQYGDLLGWEAVLDERTTPECRAADGKNFSVTDPPAIGAPGTVHGACRCVATSAYPGAEMVDDNGGGVIAAANRPGGLELAHQDGSIPVAAAGDGPRVTRSAMTGSGSSTKLDAASRRRYARSGVSRPDGSFPIRSRRDLANAIHAFGRAKDSEKPAVRAHIRRRARALGVKAPSLTGGTS